MRFTAKIKPYSAGDLLEARQLNSDFGLDRSLIFALAGRLSDGVISGLNLSVKENTLQLCPGVFKLNAEIGWLENALTVESPKAEVWSYLWLVKNGEEFELKWGKREEAGIRLAALKLQGKSSPGSAWLERAAPPSSRQDWLLSIEAVNTIQLEYAMAASFSSRPSLLPGIQQQMAPFAQDYLRIWLSNGLFPLLEYYNTQDWQAALLALIKELGSERNVQSAPAPEPTRKKIF